MDTQSRQPSTAADATIVPPPPTPMMTTRMPTPTPTTPMITTRMPTTTPRTPTTAQTAGRPRPTRRLAAVVLAALSLAVTPSMMQTVMAQSSAAGRVIHVGPTSASASGGGDGSASAPYSTIAQAISAAGSGDTVNIAAGVYHEDLNVYGKEVHLVGAGIDETIIDGSTTVDGWTASNGAWEAPWATEFSRAADIMTLPSRREAGYPEQFFLDGAPLTEVASRSAVGPGSFFNDTTRDRVVIGDNPTGRLVEGSDLQAGLYLNRAHNSTVTGLTVQRFATPQSKMAALRAYSDNITITDVAVRDNAYGGISAIGNDIDFTRVVADRNGQVGVHGHKAHGLTVTDATITRNNREMFDPSWAAGGLKVTTSNGFTITGSVVDANQGPAVWTDLDVTDSVIVGNAIRGNLRSGVMLELSQRAVIADNLILDNGQAGLYILESVDAELWHNTVLDNHWDLRILTGPRADVFDVDVYNNVFGGAVPSGQAVVHVDDWTSNRSAAEMRVTFDSNRYWRPADSNSRWLSRIQNWPASQSLTTTLSAHQAAVGGQDLSATLSTADSNMFVGDYPTGNGQGTGAQGTPLPTNIASAVGIAAGTRHPSGALTNSPAFAGGGTAAPDVTQTGPVYAPTSLAVGQSPTGLQVSWSQPSSGQRPAQYAIFVNGNERGQFTALSGEVPPDQSGSSYVQVQSIAGDGTRSAKTAPTLIGPPLNTTTTTPITAPPTTTAPAPTTTAPTTTAPPTTAPAPTTTAPATTAAPTTTPAPATTAPATTAPVTTAPVTTAPPRRLAIPINATTVENGNRITWEVKPGTATPETIRVWVTGNHVATVDGSATSAVIPETNSDAIYIQLDATIGTQTTARTAPIMIARRTPAAAHDSSIRYANNVDVDDIDGRLKVTFDPPRRGVTPERYNVWSNGVLVAETVTTDALLPTSFSTQYVQVQAVGADGSRGGKTAPIRVQR